MRDITITWQDGVNTQFCRGERFQNTLDLTGLQIGLNDEVRLYGDPQSINRSVSQGITVIGFDTTVDINRFATT